MKKKPSRNIPRNRVLPSGSRASRQHLCRVAGSKQAARQSKTSEVAGGPQQSKRSYGDLDRGFAGRLAGYGVLGASWVHLRE